MSTSAQGDPLSDLMQRLVDGADLSERESQTLTEAMAADVNLRRKYIDLMLLDELLSEKLSADTQAEAEVALLEQLSGDNLAGQPPVISVLERNATPPAARPVVTRWHLRLSTLAGVTLCLALAIYGTFILLVWQLGEQRVARQDAPSASSINAPDQPLGTLVEQVPCKWEHAADACQTKRQAVPGKLLELNGGLVRMELSSGAVVLVEGPATFSLEGENQARITRGKLVAQIPPKAKGFIVDTPLLRIVDLGTEFGVDVKPTGDADVQVLRGQVSVQPSDRAEHRSKTILVAGEFGQFTATRSEVRKADAQRHQFARLAALISPPVAPQSDDRFEVVFHFRAGENSAPIAGTSADDRGPAASISRFLKPVGSPGFVRGSAGAPHPYSVSMPGGTAAYGFAGFSDTPLPTDNFVFEAWGRSTSDDGQILAYVGNSALNGYGFAVLEGKWAMLFGGTGVTHLPGSRSIREWTHLALVRENNRHQVFVNGAPIAGRLEGFLRPPDRMIYIGHNYTEVAQTFEGEIGEVRLVRLKRLFHPDMLLWKPAVPAQPKP